jgi:ribosomal protein S27E
MPDERFTPRVPPAGPLTREQEQTLCLLELQGRTEAENPEEERILADLAAAGFAKKQGKGYVPVRGPTQTDRVQVACPSCGKKGAMRAGLAGCKVKCRGCGATFVAPALGGPSQTADGLQAHRAHDPEQSPRGMAEAREEQAAGDQREGAIPPGQAAGPDKAHAQARKEAYDLLRRVDCGGQPAFISNNLRRIAEGVGVKIELTDTPRDVIAKIRHALAATEELEGKPPAEDGQQDKARSVPDCTGDLSLPRWGRDKAGSDQPEAQRGRAQPEGEQILTDLPGPGLMPQKPADEAAAWGEQVFSDLPGAGLAPKRGNSYGPVPSGIDGWLLIPALGQGLGPFVTAGSLGLMLAFSDSHHAVAVFFAAILLFEIYVAVAFFRRKRSAPDLIIALLLVGVFFNLIMCGVDTNPSPGRLLASAIWTAIWVPYFMFSRRVKNTFIVGGPVFGGPGRQLPERTSGSAAPYTPNASAALQTDSGRVVGKPVKEPSTEAEKCPTAPVNAEHIKPHTVLAATPTNVPEWHAIHAGQEIGPFAVAELVGKAALGEIEADDLVKRTGGLWAKARELAFLQQQFRPKASRRETPAAPQHARTFPEHLAFQKSPDDRRLFCCGSCLFCHRVRHPRARHPPLA